MKQLEALKEIFLSGLDRVNPYEMIIRSMSLNGNVLNISTEHGRFSRELDGYERIIVLGAGKASARMALAVEDIMGRRITEGLVAVKYGHTEKLKKIRLMETGHPVPDENSLRAGREFLRIAAGAGRETLLINLISGGGSSIIAVPLCVPEAGIGLTLEDLRKTTEVLLSCGAEISEINCLRKHLSAIKGGRFSEQLYPAESVNLILSDVVGDRIDSIASGLTVSDPTTFGDAVKIIDKYGISGRLPKNVMEAIRKGTDGSIAETPKADDPVFEKVTNILVGSNYAALSAAREKAVQLGYNTLLLSSRMTGEASHLAGIYLGIAKDIKRFGTPVERPACIIAGGESTVTIRGGGKGGRNQETALAFLAGISGDPPDCAGIYFLSSATDGNDGPTDAAGAFASAEILIKAADMGLDPSVYLADNDSYNFFDKCGYLYKTGPTNTNVCDIQVLIVE